METDNNFLRKVSDLFLINGAKTLTMDEVAREFGISKKTLYQKYKNKEELLEAVLHFNLEEMIEHVQILDAKIDNPIERMICRDEKLDEVSGSNNSVLIRQLLKYYPAIFVKHMMNFSEKFSELLIKNIVKGRLQGLYRDDFNEENYAKIFFQLLMSYDSSPYFDTSKFSRADYQKDTLLFYLNAITTEKGKEILNKLKDNK